jgi:hypothetical protein
MSPKTGFPGLPYLNITLNSKDDSSNIWELKEIPQTLSPFSNKQQIQQVFTLKGWFSGTVAPYTPPTMRDGKGKKLLALYMVGSDLENPLGAGTADLLELIKGYNALSKKQRQQIDVVVAFGGAYKSPRTTETKDGWRGIKFASIEQLKADATDQEFGNADAYLYKAAFANTGDKSTLAQFLSYLKDGYKNHSIKTLILWDHGSAYQGFGGDHEYGGDSLFLNEIDHALTNSQIGKWDLIGFDACLMGNLEVANTIRNHANYLLASEELEPAHGWNWTAVIKAYADHDNVVDMAKIVIDNFVSDKNHADTNGKTLSVVDLSKFNALIDKLGTFAGLNLQKDATKAAMISALPHTDDYGVRKSADGKETRLSIDLKHFAQLAATGTDDAKVQQTLHQLIKAVDNYVLHTNNDGSRPNANGVSFGTFEDGLQRVEEMGLLPPLEQYSSALANFRTKFTALKQADTIEPLITKNIALANGSDLKFASKNPFSGKKGVVATFADDNLTTVSTALGALIPFESDKNIRMFLLLTEEKAHSTTTTGQYFTPTQGIQVYNVKYADDKDSEWMSVGFSHQYEKAGQTYRVYSGFADYISANAAKYLKYDKQGQPIVSDKQSKLFYVKEDMVAEYKGEDKAGKDILYFPVGTKNLVKIESLQSEGKMILVHVDNDLVLFLLTEEGPKPLFKNVIVDAQSNVGVSAQEVVQKANIEIVVDDNNTVVNHSIVTYPNNEGPISKGRKLQLGDVIGFSILGMLVNDDLTLNFSTTKLVTSKYIRFSKEPEFEVELLQDELAEEKEVAEEKDIKLVYSMMAEDIGDNFVVTKLMPVNEP